MPGRRTAHHNDPVPGRQTLKDDMIPGHPLVIDDEDDELTQQSSDQILNSVWNVGMQVRVVDDDLEPKIRCAGWMAVKDNIASGDILAHAVAESELDDVLAMEEPARRARLGRHPEKHHVFQFGKYRNERYEDVTEESPDYYFWSSQERKPSKYLQHYLGLGDRTLCCGSSAFNPHVQGDRTNPGSKTFYDKGSEADRVATQVIAPGRVEANNEMCYPV